MFGLQNYMYQPSIPNFPFIVWKWVTCPQPHVLHCLGERTHQIPVEGLAKRDDSYRKIWLDLLRFVNPEQTPIFPPVYCRVSLVNYSWKLINEKDGCLVSQTLTCSLNVVNPLHLNEHQYVFSPYCSLYISLDPDNKNLLKNQEFLCLDIISFITMTLICDSGVIL